MGNNIFLRLFSIFSNIFCLIRYFFNLGLDKMKKYARVSGTF